MHYEIPYDPQRARILYDLIWEETSKDVFSQMKQYGILAAVFLAAAIVLALDNAFGVVMLLFAFMLVFNFLLLYPGTVEEKRNLTER